MKVLQSYLILSLCVSFHCLSGMQQVSLKELHHRLQKLPQEVVENHVMPCMRTVIKKDAACNELRKHILSAMFQKTITSSWEIKPNCLSYLQLDREKTVGYRADTITIYDMTKFPWEISKEIKNDGQPKVFLVNGETVYQYRDGCVWEIDIASKQKIPLRWITNWQQLYDGKLKLSHDGSLCAFQKENSLLVHDTRSGKKIKELPISAGENITFLYFSSDNKYFIYSDSVGLKIWDIADWHLVMNHGHSTRCVEFSPKGTKLLIATQEETTVFDTHSWQKIKSIPMGSTFAMFSPDETHLILFIIATAEIALWDLASGQRAFFPHKVGQYLVSNKFLWNNKLVLIPSFLNHQEDTCLYLWDTEYQNVFTYQLEETCAFDLATLTGTQLHGKQGCGHQVLCWDFAPFKKAYDYFNALTYTQQVALYAVAQAREKQQILNVSAAQEEWVRQTLMTGDEMLDTELKNVLDPLFESSVDSMSVD